jgi:DNA repair protein RadC
MIVKDLPSEERPRERLSRYGAEALSTVELLAILLGSGTQARPVLQLAAELLAHFKTLKALTEASLAELKTVKGIGSAKAIQLKAAIALFGRLEEKKQSGILDSPDAVYELIFPELANQKIEALMVVLRDARRSLIHKEIISKGILSELLIHPREIFHEAIRHRAHSLIIAHNHPSGDPTPSTRDVEMTQLLVQAGKVIGIELSDHLIIGHKKFISFYKKGLLRRGNFY